MAVNKKSITLTSWANVIKLLFNVIPLLKMRPRERERERKRERDRECMKDI